MLRPLFGHTPPMTQAQPSAPKFGDVDERIRELARQTTVDRRGNSVGSHIYFNLITAESVTPRDIIDIQSAKGYDSRGYGHGGYQAVAQQDGPTQHRWYCYGSCDFA